MSLEEILSANTQAVVALTAAMQGKAGAVPAKAASAAATAPVKTAKAKRTYEEVCSAAVGVKNTMIANLGETAGVAATKFLISKHGSADLKGLKPAVYDAFIAECESSVEAGEVDGYEPAATADDL